MKGPSSYAAKEGQAAQRQQQQQLAAAEDEGPAGESQSTNDSIVAKEEGTGNVGPPLACGRHGDISGQGGKPFSRTAPVEEATKNLGTTARGGQEGVMLEEGEQQAPGRTLEAWRSGRERVVPLVEEARGKVETVIREGRERVGPVLRAGVEKAAEVLQGGRQRAGPWVEAGKARAIPLLKKASERSKQVAQVVTVRTGEAVQGAGELLQQASGADAGRGPPQQEASGEGAAKRAHHGEGFQRRNDGGRKDSKQSPGQEGCEGEGMTKTESAGGVELGKVPDLKSRL